MLSQTLAATIKSCVETLLAESQIDPGEQLNVMVEQPAHIEHGDYSTNIAMQLAKTLRKPPIQIANMIRDRLSGDGSFERLVRNIKVAPPGFINLFIDWKQWAHRNFELPQTGSGKVIVEHTSINPNKSAHIGHLRNSCIGDTLVRLLKRIGYRVEVHNYIDDLGNQLADTVVGLLHAPVKGNYDRFGDFCWDVYSKVNREYEVNPRLTDERTRVLHALEEGDSNLAWLGKLVAERIVREHLDEMKQFGIEYDLLVWESDIVREGFWSSAFSLLRQTSLFYLETEGKLKGCWVLKQPRDAEDDSADSDHLPDKVLVRSNGILTYTAKDIAYHLWKFGLLDKHFKYRPFSENLWTTSSDGTAHSFGSAEAVINVIDSRQEYPQAMVKQSLEALGYTKQAEKLRHVSYGVVSLSPSAAAELGIDTSDGKASYAMSGRQGIGIKISDLLDRMENVIEQKRSDHTGLASRDIAAASIRYYLLRFNLQTEVVFDIKQATETTGNTGVYLMYTHARAASLLHKAEQQWSDVPEIPEEFPPLETSEYALLRHMANWPDTLYTAAKELAPNLVCNYAHELATLFNNFYVACPILKADDPIRKFRIWLVSRYRQTLGDALEVLGLPAPERM